MKSVTIMGSKSILTEDVDRMVPSTKVIASV